MADAKLNVKYIVPECDENRSNEGWKDNCNLLRRGNEDIFE